MALPQPGTGLWLVLLLAVGIMGGQQLGSLWRNHKQHRSEGVSSIALPVGAADSIAGTHTSWAGDALDDRFVSRLACGTWQVRVVLVPQCGVPPDLP